MKLLLTVRHKKRGERETFSFYILHLLSYIRIPLFFCLYVRFESDMRQMKMKEEYNEYTYIEPQSEKKSCRFSFYSKEFLLSSFFPLYLLQITMMMMKRDASGSGLEFFIFCFFFFQFSFSYPGHWRAFICLCVQVANNTNLLCYMRI